MMMDYLLLKLSLPLNELLIAVYRVIKHENNIEKKQCLYADFFQKYYLKLRVYSDWSVKG